MILKSFGIVNTFFLNNQRYFVFEIDDVELASQIKAGQFFEITSKVQKLKIPISVHNVSGSRISFMIKIVGEGTKDLSNFRINQTVEMIGPLGNNFDIPKNEKVLFVTGGAGFIPLYLLKKISKTNKIFWIHGGKDVDDSFEVDMLFTEDGSAGKKGLVTDGMKEVLSDYSFVVSCGPNPMMKKVAELCEIQGVPLQVSLEEYMACGIGACYGCAVAIKEDEKIKYKRVCKDGPIFMGNEVAWNE